MVGKHTLTEAGNLEVSGVLDPSKCEVESVGDTTDQIYSAVLGLIPEREVVTTAIELNADEDTEAIEQRDRGVVEHEDDKGNHSKSNSNYNAEVHNVLDDTVTSVDVDYTDHKILKSVCEVTEAETSRLDHENVLEVTDQRGHNNANNDLNVLSNVLDVTKVTEMKHPNPNPPKVIFMFHGMTILR